MGKSTGKSNLTQQLGKAFEEMGIVHQSTCANAPNKMDSPKERVVTY